MKAVMPVAPPDMLKQRRAMGADRWDEMWEGILHIPPIANREQQELEATLETYLRFHWARRGKGKVYHQINLAAPGGWTKNYRIPDLILLTPERYDIDHNEYFEGAPEVVVEIHSPGDESYEKLPFYAALGVPEVWIIDRDTRTPAVYRLAERDYVQVPPAADGWILSAATSIELKIGRAGKLSVRCAGEETTREDLPED